MIPNWRSMLAALLLLLAVLCVFGVAWSYTNEVFTASCAPGQSCYDDCFYWWQYWPMCSSYQSCIVFKGWSGDTGEFTVCVPTTQSTDECNTYGQSSSTTIACNGWYWTCGCRNAYTGDCEARSCRCAGTYDGSTAVYVNTICE